MKYDFLAIGDCVVDNFIRLKVASVRSDSQKDESEICMPFKDKIPYEETYIIPTVGNSPNAAVSAARLELKTALVSDIGGDHWGKECLEVLKTEKISKDYVKIHKDKKTNYHYVLWYEDDRTILIKHEKYDYKLPKVNPPKWLYLSSLGEESLDYHKEIENYLQKNPEIKLAFQPGTYQIKFGYEKLAGIYKRTEVFFCNREEAGHILNKDTEDIKELLGAINSLGPKIVVITDGAAGAYVFGGGEFWFMPSYPDIKPPFERTGAGDAFASTFTSALALGMNLEEAMRWAPINSMSVVQYVGAREGLLKRNQIEEYLRVAPADYKPSRI